MGLRAGRDRGIDGTGHRVPMRLTGRSAANRRLKFYVMELCVPDMRVELDEWGEVEFLDIERIICYPAIAHGPEQAIEQATGNEPDRVESIRRVRSAGLMRAMLVPDDELFDLHRAELEEQVEEMHEYE